MCSALIVSKQLSYVRELFSLEESRNCQPINEINIEEAIESARGVDRIYLDLEGKGLPIYLQFCGVAPQAEIIIISPSDKERRYFEDMGVGIWTPANQEKKTDYTTDMSDLAERVERLESWIQSQIHVINRQLTQVVGENTSAHKRAQLYANIDSKVKKTRVVYGRFQKQVTFWAIVTSILTSVTCVGIIFLIRRLSG